MRYLIFIICLMSFHAFAHDGHDHGKKKEAPKQSGKSYFTINSSSENFELVLRYDPFKANEYAEFKLFVSDFETNQAIDTASINVTCLEDQNLKFVVSYIESGIYNIKGVFPEDRSYTLVVNIVAGTTADLMTLKPVEVGKELKQDESSDHSIMDNIWMILLFIFTGFAGGVVLTMLFMRKRQAATYLLGTGVALIVLTQTLNPVTPVYAHEGHTHGKEKEKKPTIYSSVQTDEIEILKETQFLFDIHTTFSKYSTYNNILKLYGKVMPTTNGEAKIIAPQNASIVSLNVKIGQHVRKGQILMVIEQTLNASEQIQFATEKSNANAEYESAKKEYERLETIRDIVASKDLLNAEIHYRTSTKNKEVYDNLSSTGSLNKQLITIKSPIDGKVDNYNLAIGEQIGQGDYLFSVYNTTRLKVEAQIFDKDFHKITNDVGFFVECVQEEDHFTESARLITYGTKVNSANQSSQIILEMDNTDNLFKPGQFVNVTVMAKTESKKIVVPTTAVSDINGKPVIYVHSEPEIFKVKFIALGNSNREQTIVIRGLGENERVVTNGAYQVKSIFLSK